MIETMIGGIRASNLYKNKPPKEAFNFFMDNLKTCSILTDDSVSCITLVCELKEGVKSPYQSMRSNNFNLPVKKMLLKIFLHTSSTNKSNYIEIPTRSFLKQKKLNPFAMDKNVGMDKNTENNLKELTSAETLINEIELHQDIYNRSFIDELSPCEPICPAIITYQIGLNQEDKNNLHKLLTKNDTFIPKTEFDIEVLDNYFNFESISFISMEMLDNFFTLADLIQHEKYRDNYNMYMLISAWEFARLCGTYGISHNDAHHGNVMVNPDDTNYFGNKNGIKGRAIIIDFGRSSRVVDDASNKNNNLFPFNLIKQPPQIDNSIKNHPLIKKYIEPLLCGSKSDWGNASFLFRVLGIKIEKMDEVFNNPEYLDKIKSYIIFFEKLTKARQSVAKTFLKNFSKNYGKKFNNKDFKTVSDKLLTMSKNNKITGGHKLSITNKIKKRTRRNQYGRKHNQRRSTRKIRHHK